MYNEKQKLPNFLKSLGFTGQFNQAQMDYLKSLGLSGQLNDMWKKHMNSLGRVGDINKELRIWIEDEMEAILTNGKFYVDGNWVGGYGATVDTSSGSMVVTTANPKAFGGGVSEGFPTIIGEDYRIIADLKYVSGERALLGKSDSRTAHVNISFNDTTIAQDQYSKVFTATATTSYIWCGSRENSSGVQITEWDNVSVVREN